MKGNDREHTLLDKSWGDVTNHRDDILLIEEEEEEEAEIKQSTPKSTINNNVSTGMIASVIISYFIVSMGLVFMNKIILSDDVFPYPMLITFIQFIVAFFCFFISSTLTPKLKIESLNFITPVDFNLQTAKTVLPVTIVYLLMLITNNICLYYVEVSFYQIARSLTIIFTVILTFYILKKSTSLITLMTCSLIIFGFIFGSKGESNFSITGVSFGVISSFFVALYNVVIKFVMKSLNDDHWRLLFYNTVMSSVLLLPILLWSGEISVLMERGLENPEWIWTINIFAGIMGFALNIIMALQIKFTSPLTNIISGTVKATIQTGLAFLIFKTPINFLNLFGIFLVLVGSAAYSYVRYLEMSK